MASYSIRLKEICDIYSRDEVEKWFKSYKLEDFLTPTQIDLINKFAVWNKDKLAKKIVNHYFMREIGFETPALFKLHAENTMNEIMEKYLLLIYSRFLEYDPLSNVDYVEKYTREIKGKAENQGTSNSNSNSNSEGLNINNDTPQTNINKQDLETGAFASSVSQSENNSHISDETNTSNSGTSETVETYTHEMQGDNGVIVTNEYLVREFRELATSFDEQIINELNKLFMCIY